jgi:hypothetical protein
VLQPRRQSSSYSPPWKPQILLLKACCLYMKLGRWTRDFLSCFLFRHVCLEEKVAESVLPF